MNYPPIVTTTFPSLRKYDSPGFQRVGDHILSAQKAVVLKFSGNQRKSFWQKLMLLAAALIPLGAGAANAQSTNQSSVSTSLAVSAQQADIDEAKSPFIDSAKDVPQLNGTMQQAVVDLARNPLLSPQTRQDIEKLLTEFNKSSDGQMAVVVIPDTHRREINTLATEIFNQIGIGHAGKNDGTILLLNKAAMQEGRKTGRMQITTGSGIKYTLSGEKAVEILKQNALPDLKAGNYDRAVQKTVQAVTQLLQKSGQSNTLLGSDTKTSASREDEHPIVISGDNPILIGFYAVSALLLGGFILKPLLEGSKSSSSSGDSYDHYTPRYERNDDRSDSYSDDSFSRPQPKRRHRSSGSASSYSYSSSRPSRRSSHSSSSGSYNAGRSRSSSSYNSSSYDSDSSSSSSSYSSSSYDSGSSSSSGSYDSGTSWGGGSSDGSGGGI